ncbi:hypothetical protein MesoLjLc_41320 [Mesorhizobium sp. L-8-10]|uniref:anthrone oxygenase family protein n=1 Tax=unclassified Mesorhizobium TaxID=325217 RepID=UPI0019269CA9|nr:MULTISPECIES: anthrone oxygenase family protein [unclassified Mesorhizobium]BCH24469.1 hypothetical protein MesoLjLb_42540 [Mesorhizobium sp. L-8-3]BCH32202.1 hypothetical protein MesoLjLc_41320 [Mesorhizobium sp. L-8-10]
MFEAFQVLTLLLVAVALASVLAHAMELPGKLRLAKEEYLAVQPIYYPGFTVAGGVGEAGGLAATFILTILWAGSPGFWLVFCAFLAMLVMHALYWILTHPVNNFWLKDSDLSRFGVGFFSFGARDEESAQDWRKLRDRWEYSHVARAFFAMLAFLLLAIAYVVR